MDQPLRITLTVLAALFQSTLFLRFSCDSLGIRADIQRKRALRLLAGGILTGLLFLLHWHPMFPGSAFLCASLYLIGFAALYLEGNAFGRIVLPVLLPVSGALGQMFASGFWQWLSPEGEAVFPEAILTSGVILGIYGGGKALGRRLRLAPEERTAFYTHLAVSLALLLLLLCCGIDGSPKLRLLLSAGGACVILWGFGFGRILADLHELNAGKLESNLVRLEKSSQHQVEEMRFQCERLQKAQHDFRNTLQVLRTLNAERKPAQIDAYIAAYLDPSRGGGFIVSENAFANAIINAKTSLARQQGIEVKLAINAGIPEHDPVDICNLLGNMFDNAMEACLQVKDSPRISLQIYENGAETVFCMRNSIAHPVLEFNPELRSSKKDAGNHGYGTGIIREIAAKYRGFADFYEESGEFCCNAVLYLE